LKACVSVLEASLEITFNLQDGLAAFDLMTL
jgi:hypothetical protein